MRDSHSHGQISELPVPPSSPCEERASRVPVWPCQENYVLTRRPTKRKHHLTAVLRNHGYPAGFIDRSKEPVPTVVDVGEATQETVDVN